MAAIAESGHVLSFKRAFENLARRNGDLSPMSVGVSRASTFQGFCAKHDTELFKTIEGGQLLLNAESAFLLSFRAIAYEHFQKDAALRNIDVQREIDRGRSFIEQCEIQEWLNAHAVGLRQGLDDIRRCKAEYDAAFNNGHMGNYHFVGVEFSRALPVVSCGAFFPEFDFQGNALQRVGHGDAILDHIVYNLTVVGGKSLAVLGWIGEQASASQFARSFQNVSNEAKTNAAIRLAFEQLENTYMQDSWWKCLSDSHQRSILTHVRSGLAFAPSERSANSLLDDGCEYFSADVLSEVAAL